MVNKKLFLFVILGIFLISIISAQGVSYCCERLGNSGPWCQNAPENQCGSNYRSVPTSCEATSYCKLGVCVNTKEGTCLTNTPQKVCDDNGGVWDERDKDEIPQCQLGCCLIGEQAAFVTLTRCKSLSSLYGLEINYRTDIQSEIGCIANAMPKVKGACVYEKEYEKTCEFLTKKECQEINAEFHEGYLCSSNELGTNCGPRGGTTCVEGKDEVYFLDTCGNLANVYDYSKLNKQSYWEKIIAPDCGSDSNAGSKDCGDCDYLLGSTCKKGSANYGDFICEDLACYEGSKKTAEHGETWCAESKGIDESLPGSRHFRLVCYNGEISVEPCADFRQEVCIESSINGFKTAACRVNMWQDCYSQDNKKDCENTDQRDCQWNSGLSILMDETGESLAIDEDGNKIEASCIPKHAPGFNFWEEGDAESLCSLASTQCFVEYEAKIGEALTKKRGDAVGDWRCLEKCRAECGWDDPLNICKNKCKTECPLICVDKDGNILDSWKKEMNDFCISLGDCGSSLNYVRAKGYYDVDDFITRGEEDEED